MWRGIGKWLGKVFHGGEPSPAPAKVREIDGGEPAPAPRGIACVNAKHGTVVDREQERRAAVSFTDAKWLVHVRWPGYFKRH